MPQSHAEIADIFNRYIDENRNRDISPIRHIVRNYQGGMSPICVCVQLIIYIGCIGYHINKGYIYADELVKKLCMAINCHIVMPICMRIYNLLMSPAIRHIDILYNVRTLVEHLMRNVAQFMNNVSYEAVPQITQQLLQIWIIFNSYITGPVLDEVQVILQHITNIMHEECVQKYNAIENA